MYINLRATTTFLKNKKLTEEIRNYKDNSVPKKVKCLKYHLHVEMMYPN